VEFEEPSYRANTDSASINDNNGNNNSSGGGGGGGGGGGQDGKFAELIRGMSSDRFLSCLLLCFENLLRAVVRAHNVHVFMTNSLFNGGNGSGNGSSSGSGNGGGDLSSNNNVFTLSQTCVVSSCDVAQRALAQLLSLKKSDMARITLDKMKLLWETAMNFITETEAISGTSAYIIRQALHAQTSMFLSTIHERNKIRVITTMDHEKWTQCDVPVEIQASFERLVEGRATSEASSSSSSSSSSSPSSSDGDKKPISAPAVLIDGVQYKVVWSALELCSTIMSYLDVAVSFASVTGDIINMIKDLVRMMLYLLLDCDISVSLLSICCSLLAFHNTT
jgi:hypothetical protein